MQIALTLVLLKGGSLLFRTIQNLWAVNPGFDPQHVITFQAGLSPSATQTPISTRIAYQQLLERIRQIPGVLAADLTALVPLSQNDNSGPFWVGTHQPASMAEIPRALYYWTGPDYIRTMEIPLLRGRFLSPEDTTQSAQVIVVDSMLARAYFPHEDPIGQTVTVPHWGVARIVGVVEHVEHWRLGGSDPQLEKPQIYASFYQLWDAWVPTFRMGLTIAVRTPLEVSTVIPAIKAAVYGADGDQPVYNVRTMQEIVSASMASQRLPMALLSAFAVLARLLAYVGIYGVISYSMTQRIRELGIRIALGAVKRDVLGMVIGQGLKLAAAGVAIGAIAALVLTRLLSSFFRLLFGVRANDPLTFVAVSFVLLGAALLACYFPARRAASVDPMVALRHD
ncbi:MAG: FtsX-like permease family protein [Bryobacteraceae bacterium]